MDGATARNSRQPAASLQNLSLDILTMQPAQQLARTLCSDLKFRFDAFFRVLVSARDRKSRAVLKLPARPLDLFDRPIVNRAIELSLAPSCSANASIDER